MKDEPTNEKQEIDPEELLRRMLQISPEDAEKVRDRTPGTRGKPEKRRQEGPSADHGNG